MYAMVNSQGTAMAETALCDKHYVEPYISLAKEAGLKADDIGKDVTFHDASDNEMLKCIGCE